MPQRRASIAGRSVREWNTTEIRILRNEAAQGAEALAFMLDRSVSSVRSAAKRLRISLRRPGQRCGLVLGQPRGVALSAVMSREMAEELRSDPARASLVAQRLEVDRAGGLCPCCGMRPIRVRSSGLCMACHKTRLADGHRETAAEACANRDWWLQKQQLRRARAAQESAAR